MSEMDGRLEALRWRDLHHFNHPTSRELAGHSATLVGRHIYVFGGFDNRSHQFYGLSLDDFKWKKMNDPPPYRYLHTAHLVDDRMFLLGGSQNGKPVKRITIYDFVLEKSFFKNSQDLLYREGHCGVYVENRKQIIIFGGDTIRRNTRVQTCCLNVETFQTSPLSPKGKPPPARLYSSEAVLKGMNLFVLGLLTVSDGYTFHLYVLNLEAGSIETWSKVQLNTQITSMMPYFSAVHYDDYLVVLGRDISMGRKGALYLLNLKTKETSTIGPYTKNPDLSQKWATSGRWVTKAYRHRPILAKDRVIFVGGYNMRHVMELTIGSPSS